MPDYKLVRMQDGAELLAGGSYRNYVRAEIMIGEFGPFSFTVTKEPGWEIALKQQFDDQVRNVRSITT